MTFSELPFNTQSAYPLLALLQLLPILFAGLVCFARAPKIATLLGVVGAVLEFALAIYVYRSFNYTSADFQFAEHLTIFGAFKYHAAVDGVSILFVLLTTLVTLLVILYGRARPLPHWRYNAVVLLVEAAVISQFVSVDLLWFIFASILQLGLIGYMLVYWGTAPDKNLAIRRYWQFMSIGILLLGAGALLLGWNHAVVSKAGFSFDLFDLSKTPIRAEYASIIFFLIFYGLAIRVPLFPLHGWLLPTAQHGTIAVAPIFLLGLKTGIFGMLRYIFPLMKDAVELWSPYVAGFAIAGVFYAAILALVQTNLRLLLAYAVVSHTSILVIGLFSLSHTGMQGSVMLSVNFGFAMVGLLLVIGLIYRRTDTMTLSRLGGLFDPLPLLGIAFLVAGLAIVGMPGTPGFDAAHLMLEAAIHRFGAVLTILAALGNVIAAGFLLRAFQRAFLAPHPEGAAATVEPAKFLEKLIAVAVVILLVVAGFYLEPWLRLIDKSLYGISVLYGSGH